MKRSTAWQEDLTTLSVAELEALIARCEGAVFTGTSTHRDVVILIDAEAEVQWREREAFKQLLQTERQLRASRTGSGDSGTLTL